MENDVVIAFLAGGLFVGIISFYLSRMILRAEVIELIQEETERIISDYEWKLTYLKKKLLLTERQRDIAITDAKEALKERNEALIMLTKKLSDE